MSEPTRRDATIIVFAYMVMVAFVAGAAILRGETANTIRLFEAGGSLAALVVLIEAGVPLARAVRNKFDGGASDV